MISGALTPPTCGPIFCSFSWPVSVSSIPAWAYDASVQAFAMTPLQPDQALIPCSPSSPDCGNHASRTRRVTTPAASRLRVHQIWRPSIEHRLRHMHPPRTKSPALRWQAVCLASHRPNRGHQVPIIPAPNFHCKCRADADSQWHRCGSGYHRLSNGMPVRLESLVARTSRHLKKRPGPAPVSCRQPHLSPRPCQESGDQTRRAARRGCNPQPKPSRLAAAMPDQPL